VYQPTLASEMGERKGKEGGKRGNVPPTISPTKTALPLHHLDATSVKGRRKRNKRGRHKSSSLFSRVVPLSLLLGPFGKEVKGERIAILFIYELSGVTFSLSIFPLSSTLMGKKGKKGRGTAGGEAFPLFRSSSSLIFWTAITSEGGGKGEEGEKRRRGPGADTLKLCIGAFVHRPHAENGEGGEEKEKDAGHSHRSFRNRS